MSAHDHDHELGELRPTRARTTEREDAGPALTAQAASAGRWDVVGHAGLLGLQRSMGNAAVASALEAPAEDHDEAAHEQEDRGGQAVQSALGSGGRPLDPEVRSDMQGRLGHDFSDVRIHDDGQAHDSAVAVNAHAYTVGSDIVFRSGGYDPNSDAGRTTLAHELTHVVQQRSGPVDGTPTGDGLSISSPDDRFEREASATAERAVSGPAPVAAVGAGSGAGAPVQREAAEEEDESLQMMASAPSVQREAAEEDEEPAE